MRRRNFEMEEGANKSRNEAIIILSSDEEEDEDVQDLFKDFVSKLERFVAQKDVVLFLKLKFAEARPEFVSSAKFKNALKWRTKQLDDSNGYIYTGDICKLLAADSKQDDCKPKLECAKMAVERDSSSSGNYDAELHSTRVEVGENKNTILTIDGCEESKHAVSAEEIPSEVADPERSTSSANPTSSEHVKIKKQNKGKVHKAGKVTNGSTPTKHPLTPQKREELVDRLYEKLKHVSDQIKILDQAELSLDEMAMSDSTYIKECRLKERYSRIWDKICKVRGRPPRTGRFIEKEVKCPPTGFSEIDQAINKFLKSKRGRFPDIFDIKNVVLETKKKHGLKIPSQTLDEISREVFTSVGNTLQRRRKRDFQKNFGCSLTDSCDAKNDPALSDSVLRKKLEENKRVNKRALDEVFNRYTHYGRMNTCEDSDDSSSSDSEETASKNSLKGAMKGRFSHISVTDLSDSSDNERDDFGLESEGTDEDNENAFERGSTSGKIAKKRHSDLKSSNASESDLDDFVIKKPCQITERAHPTKSMIEHDDENNMASHSEETDVSSTCAIVELPSSVLSDCIDVTGEQTGVAEMHEECSSADDDAKRSQHFETDTTVEPDINKKQVEAVTNVLRDAEDTSVQDIPQCDVSKHQQTSDSGEKLDSDLDKRDLITSSRSSDSDPAGPSSLPNSVDCINNMPDLFTDSVANSSDSTNVDNGVGTEKSSKENGKPEIPQDPVTPRKDKSAAGKLSGKPSLVIPLMAVSRKDQKSPLLSLSTKKRKAENGSLEYESPLKIFRSATLHLMGKKADTDDQKRSCKESTLSSKKECDEPSVAATDKLLAPAIVNGHSPLQKHGPRKLALSLDKSGRNSPKKQNMTVSTPQTDVKHNNTIIVLDSDDESDT